MAQTLLIDITRLGEYDVLIKKYIGKAEGRISTKLGTVPAKIGSGEDEQEVNDLVDYINKKVALANGNASALAYRVQANEDAIGKQNTAAEGQASNATGLYAYVDSAAAAAISKVVANASTSYDTLQEFEAWILSDIDGAAAMQRAIKVLEGTDGSAPTKASNSIPGVKLYIDDLVSNKNVDAAVAEGELLMTATPADNKVTLASTQKLKDAVTRAEASVQDITLEVNGSLVKFALDKTSKNIKVSISDADLSTKIEGMYGDMQGNTAATVAEVEAKVDLLEVCSDTAISGLFAGIELD